LRYPNDKERKIISKKINNAIEIIQALNPAFVYSNPEQAVHEISNTVDYYKKNDIGNVKVNNLSYLWLDCLVKQYNWEWTMWDWETGAGFGVSNKDKDFYCQSDSIIIHTISGLESAQIISQLYQDVKGRDFLNRDIDYFGIGLLFETSHLKFKS
jgi:hypothetical protein